MALEGRLLFNEAHVALDASLADPCPIGERAPLRGITASSGEALL